MHALKILPILLSFDDITVNDVGSRDSMHRSRTKLQQGRVRLDIKKYFHAVRMARHWSSLPREVVGAPCLSVLKWHLNNALSNMH